MDEVNIYIYTTIKGPGKRSGSYTYILETPTAKGPVTKTIKGTLEGESESSAALKVTLAALGRLNKPCTVTVYTDTSYLKSGVEWMPRWKEQGWLTSKKTEVVNRSLWERLDEMLQKHTIEFKVDEKHAYRSWLMDNTEKDEKRRNQ